MNIWLRLKAALLAAWAIVVRNDSVMVRVGFMKSGGITALDGRFYVIACEQLPDPAGSAPTAAPTAPPPPEDKGATT